MRSRYVPPSPRSARFALPWLLSACFILVATANAAPLPLSLEDARRRAADAAPSLGALSARLVAAREEASRAAALPDPMLTLGIDNLTVTGADACRRPTR
jgi:cobalt-zinc-cadmium efflux system outer membrane protein